MPNFDGKTWFRTNIKFYLTIIKNFVNGLVLPLTTRVGSLESAVTSLQAITGAFKATKATYAELLALTGRNGDWAILSTDDGANESGIYVKNASGWQFACDLVTFQDISAQIMATDPEVAAGTSTTKVMSVKQVVDKINAAIYTINISGKADLAGSATQKFNVAAATDGSTQAVQAAQFTTIIASEAQTDWDNS